MVFIYHERVSHFKASVCGDAGAQRTHKQTFTDIHRSGQAPKQYLIGRGHMLYLLP